MKNLYTLPQLIEWAWDNKRDGTFFSTDDTSCVEIKNGIVRIIEDAVRAYAHPKPYTRFMVAKTTPSEGWQS